ncbi:DUF2834 domain-containing protein [Frigidibacter mobilis]|uniref:K+-transporting ATPase, A chain n=1 Tax=Frigidibacter mobilis TaxID=1335048 RepID=A0A161GVT7_9RHOB|nr:DUF2834 domain-containing protein [Frigidibacter mobilis]AMY67429.1 hypothetical protein AKL17_0167 [Frigidibacter mobilis]
MSLLRLTYLLLALAGAVLPMRHYLDWLRANGWSLGGMIDAWFVNAATTGMVWDLLIAAIALIVWALAETWVRRNWIALLALPATLCIGVSCGLPLYLFLRSGRVS